MEVNDVLNLLVRSMKRSAVGMCPWSIEELTLGIYRLFYQHSQEGAIDTIPGSKVDSIDEVDEICHWLGWSHAAYLEDKALIAKSLQIDESQIKKHVRTSAVLRPSYYIAVDDQKQSLVMAIRGTQTITDILTDLNPHSENFGHGYGHSGILSAAKWLMEQESRNLQILLRAYPGHKLVLTGHSLGAGIASLLSILLQDLFVQKDSICQTSCMNSPVVCWGFGCPPCADRNLSENSPTIKNVVLQDDIVARLCPLTLERLRLEISNTKWSETFAADSKLRKIVDLVQTTQGFVNNLEEKLGYQNGHFVQQMKSIAISNLVTTNLLSTSLAGKSSSSALTNAQKFSNWISLGASAAIQLSAKLATVKDDVPETNKVATLSDKTSETGKELIDLTTSDNEPLYVPGILYHVLYNKTQNPLPTADTETLANINDSEDESTNKEYYVIQGNDPTVRFRRIILSSSMISDHRCQSYEQAIQDSLKSIRSNLQS